MRRVPELRDRPAAVTGVMCALLVGLTGTGIVGPGGLTAQETVRVRPGPEYRASGLERWLLGSGYRALWVAPVEVEVLDLARFAGGLSPIERGGGGQTRTLHMRGEDGRRYIFRSVRKYVGQTLPEDLRDTWLHSLFQDQMSTLHPTGALMVPPLLEATGVLHVEPRLVVMPDDPRLGEHREGFAGMLGQIEDRPNEGPDDTPGFAGSSKVVGMERLLERIEEDPAQRPAAEEYLAARLTDFLIGDTDRGADQWRWASEETRDGGLLWRPIPRDRDWAFVRSDGLLSRVARLVFPKLIAFSPSPPSLTAMTFSSIPRDRRLLAELPRESWDSVALAFRAAVTDERIEEAVAGMPPEHRAVEGARLARALRARRDALPGRAAAFYEMLAGDVDVHGTETADDAIVEFLPDGSVDVQLSSDQAATDPYFHRRFRPGETQEVRVYLLDGADRAVLRGSDPSSIAVRVIGGPGDDLLVDSTAGRAAAVALYDAEGANTIRANPSTRVDRRAFEPPEGAEGFIGQKVTKDRFRDWGRGRSIQLRAAYGEGAGVIIGARRQATRYGFRRDPYATRRWVQGSYALGSRGFGAEAGARRTWENSTWSASLVFDAAQYDAIRFYGYGNDTAVPAGHATALVMQHRVRLTPGVAVEPSPDMRLAFGLRARYTDPRPPAGSPLESSAAVGGAAYGTAGGWIEAQLDRPVEAGGRWVGYGVAARGAIHPGIWDLPGPFGTAELEARGYVGGGPTLAVRAGTRKAWGTFPAQDAAFIGGRSTLRGYRYQRFAGDGAVYGSTELRTPLARVQLVARGELGALAFADAGRAFVGAASPGGWHIGYGAGLSFTTLGAMITASWARGEENRIYLDLGRPF